MKEKLITQLWLLLGRQALEDVTSLSDNEKDILQALRDSEPVDDYLRKNTFYLDPN